MDKKEIINKLKSFPYSKEDYWILTGGAMVLYGIKKQTSDIDLGCNKKMADELERDGFFFGYTESGNRHFKYGDDIEIFENWLNGTVIRVENIPVISIPGLIDMKRELGREKDFKDIELINEFMKKKELKIYPADKEQMEVRIAEETDAELKKAYKEMLQGCLEHPDKWDWYAMWIIEDADGTHVGDLCFKGLDDGKNPEIGYGINEEFRGRGYATEAAELAIKWAFEHPEVKAVEAETDPENVASQKVLAKCGFKATGIMGEEGPRYIKYRTIEIEPFDMKYLDDYYKGFNSEITKYQWPNPFESIEDAKGLLSDFLDEMEKGETLLYSVVSDDKSFLGSVEMHGLTGDCPEVGVWITEAAQKKGYAYEALKALLDYARTKHHKNEFYYEADIRNIGSTKLLHKFEDEYEIIKQDLDECVTDSGKELKLQGYVLRAK